MSPNRPAVPSAFFFPVTTALAGLMLLLSPPVDAACPPGDSYPITSGDSTTGPIVVLGGLGPAPVGSFFLAGSGDRNHSGTLPPSAWLSRAGDSDGDGLPEIRVDAPGEGPGGWGDPSTVGCPSDVSPPHPPLLLFVRHDREDLDGDSRFDVFEDRNRNGVLDPGEDLDGDGRLTPLPRRGVGGGCEGILREDLDCDGILDRLTEDLNGNGRLDPGEDRDADGHLDVINEDRNNNNILDDVIFNGGSNNDLIPDEEGNFGNFYPYMAARPAPGSFVIVAVAWDGRAYDLQDMRLATMIAGVNEDLDRDGAFDVFEDFVFRNGRLDPGEDRDGDGRLTPPGACEGTTREDRDCDGRLDRIDEDFNHNGRLDPGEDLDGDRRLDDGTEDRNNDNLLNDRPFPSPDDVIFEYFPDGSSRQLPPCYPYGSLTPAQEVRVLAARPLPSEPQAGDCPRQGATGQPVVRIVSIDPFPSGALNARVSISDPNADLLSGRVEIGDRIVVSDSAHGSSDLCAGPLLPQGVPGRGAMFVGGVGLPPFLIDLDSVTGCDDGQSDFGFAYGACAESSGMPVRSILTLSCAQPFPICVRRLDAGGTSDYIVHQVDPAAAVLSGASPALPSVPFEASRLPRAIDLRALPSPGLYALTITADDGASPIAIDSLLFGWNGERAMFINHRRRAGSVLLPDPGPEPTPVPVE